MVFHHFVGREDIGTDLTAPAVILLFAADAVEFVFLHLPLAVEELRFEQAKGFIQVRVLGAFVLTGNDDAGFVVGQADGAVGLVDVLSAGAAGAEGILAVFIFLEIDLIVKFNLRNNVQRSEGGRATFRASVRGAR